jgi:cell division septation protein DedD
MNQENRDYPPTDPDREGPPGQASPSSPREPRFSAIDQEVDYEEPDRDTDFAGFYDEEDGEEEFEDLTDTRGEREATSIWSFEEPDGEEDQGRSKVSPRGTPSTDAAYDDDEAYDWEDEEYPDERDTGPRQWPVGMIIVGIVALVLLGAGGYGVIQQRAAMEEEIRQLQAALAVSVSPEEVAASRSAVAEVERSNSELQDRLDALVVENRQLKGLVSGLESELQAQQEALAKKPPAAPPPAKQVPPPAAPVAKPEKAAPAATGEWFVNFGSYARRDTAEVWSGKLDPRAGQVVVSTGTLDGKTLYRVRVVGLASREQAESIARQLEKAYDLPRLWVGRE